MPTHMHNIGAFPLYLLLQLYGTQAFVIDLCALVAAVPLCIVAVTGEKAPMRGASMGRLIVVACMTRCQVEDPRRSRYDRPNAAGG